MGNGISTMGHSMDQIDNLRKLQLRMSTLSTQMATGKKTRTFDGLGTDVIASERARANIKALVAYENNITVASRRLKLMDNSLSQTRKQAQNVLSAIQVQTQSGEIDKDSVGELAGKLRGLIAEFVNEKDGDRFVFSGAETTTKPLGDTSAMDTYMQSKLDDWLNGTIDSDALIKSYRDRTQLTDTTVGYSAQLSSGSTRGVSVRVDEYAEVDYTVLANDQGLRDIIVAIGMLDKLCCSIDEVTLDDDSAPGTTTAPGVTQKEQNENFYKVFNDIGQMLSSGLKNLEKSQFTVSQSLSTITEIQSEHAVQRNILKGQVDDIENVDMNEVAVQINFLSIQLEASYRVTATLSNLNLSNFLS